MAQLRVDTTTGSPLITVDSGAINMSALAASTWQTLAGILTINGAAGIELTGGVNVSGASSFSVSASGTHRFTAGTVQIATLFDWNTAAAVTASGNPSFNFGTGAVQFGGPVTVGSTFDVVGSLRSELNVTITTAAVSLLTTDSGTVYTNEGAAGPASGRPVRLPVAQAGLHYTFINQDASDIRVVANGGDTVRIAGSVSLGGGNIESNAVGDTAHLICINATEWIADSVTGTWTVT